MDLSKHSVSSRYTNFLIGSHLELDSFFQSRAVGFLGADTVLLYAILVRGFTTVKKHHDQKQPMEERVNPGSQFIERSQNRNPD